MFSHGVKSSKYKNRRVFKNSVWKTFFGAQQYGQCWICHKQIVQGTFMCCCVLPEVYGGAVEIDNIRPLCAVCESNVNSRHLFDLMCMLRVAPPQFDWEFEAWKERWLHSQSCRNANEEPMDLDLRVNIGGNRT